MILKDEIFPIGQITKAHGLKGELSFTTTSAILEDVEVPFVILEPEGLLVPFYIESVRMKTDTTGLLKLERVDTEEQAAALRETGCDEVQGYLYARSMPVAACETYLRGRA